MLHTALSEADRLGILKVPHPMRDKRVRLPRLPKPEPAVVDKQKLKLLFGARTRLYPFIVLAAGTGCRRGELLALEWPDLNMKTGELVGSKSLEQTKAGLRVKGTKSESRAGSSCRKQCSPCWPITASSRTRMNGCLGRTTRTTDFFSASPAADTTHQIGWARVKELMVAVGLDGVSLHSVRHTNATELLRNSVPIAEVSRRLGHADQKSRYRSTATPFPPAAARRRRYGTMRWVT